MLGAAAAGHARMDASGALAGRWWCARAFPAATLFHLLLHVPYTLLAAAAPEWCIAQNLRRVRAPRDAARRELLWHVSLNLLNLLDAAYHACAFVLMVSLSVPAG